METIINRHETVRNAWLAYRQEANMPTLEYQKYDEGVGEQIKEALLLWKFVRRYYNFEYSDYTRNELKRGFLRSILADEIEGYRANPYVNLVAQIEMLPTTIWRKLLWKHNFDYQSHESFLRRINTGQIMAIARNWKALFETHSMPPVLKVSMRDKVEFAIGYALGTYSNEKFLEENLFDDLRYMSKSAMSYSLMGLDFGFTKYSNGLNNDDQSASRSVRKFLERKNHVNDFVVDMEYGKYWTMYRTARKNYVWKAWSSKEVQLKPYVCPGFWFTLFMHLLFWIICPLLFIQGGAHYLITHHFTAYNVTMMILGAMTPLWLAIAALRLLVDLVFKAIGSVFEAMVYGLKETEHGKQLVQWISKKISDIGDWWSDQKEYIGYMAACIGILIVCVILYALPVIIFEKTWLASVALRLSAIITTTFIISVVISAIESNNKNNYWTPRLWALFLAEILAVSGLVFISQISRFFARCYGAIQSLIGYIAENYFVLITYGIYVVFFVVLMRPIYYAIKWNDEKYEKLMRRFPTHIALCTIAVGVMGLIRTGLPDRNIVIGLLQSSGWFALWFILFGSIAYFVMRFMLRERMEKTGKRKEIVTDGRSLSKSLSSYLLFDNEPKLRTELNAWVNNMVTESLWRNDWMFSNRKTKAVELFEGIGRIADSLFYNPIGYNKESRHYVKRFIKMVLPSVTPQLVREITENLDRLKGYDPEEVLYFIQTLVDQKTFSKANQLFLPVYEQKQQQKRIESEESRERRIRRQRAWAYITHPFVVARNKVQNFYRDLIKVKEELKEHCPYIAQPRRLD